MNNPPAESHGESLTSIPPPQSAAGYSGSVEGKRNGDDGASGAGGASDAGGDGRGPALPTSTTSMPSSLRSEGEG